MLPFIAFAAARYSWDCCSGYHSAKLSYALRIRLVATETVQRDKIIALLALALLVMGCIAVLWPFLTVLVWAVILSFSTWPVYAYLRRWVGGRATLAATLMTLLVTVALLAPFAVVVAGLAENADELADVAQKFMDEGLPDPPAWIKELPLAGASADAYWRSFVDDGARLIGELTKLLQPLRPALTAAGAALAHGLLLLALSVFLTFFFFRDGEAAAARLQTAMARLAGTRAQHLIGITTGTITGVVYGILGTALAQGLLAAIGFAIAGVPGASLLGLATFFLSIVPFGPPLLWIPAAIWLFYHGAVGWAVFLVLWGFIVVSGVDNVIKPLIISRGSNLPFVLVFLGVLGGIVAFGFLGVFLGPTLLAVGYRLLLEWSEVEQPAQFDVESKPVSDPR